MTIKIEPGISLDKTKIKKEAKEGEPEASEGRDELVTPEPTGEDGDAVVLDGDDHQGRDNPTSTIEITKVSGADDRVKKSEEKKEQDKQKEFKSRSSESKEQTSGVVGELFTQLVGEVEKINEGVEKKQPEDFVEKEGKTVEDADDRDEDIDLTISFATAITGTIEDAPKDMEDMEMELEPKSIGNRKTPTLSTNSKNRGDQLGEPEKRSNGEDEEGESAPSKQSDDWLPEDALEEDIDGEEEYFNSNGTAEEEDVGSGDEGGDDFGGYDPLKLAQMSESDLNELDFEMDDDGMEVTTEDHEIFDENSEGVDGNEDVSNSSGNRSDKKENELEEEDDAGLSENVSTDYGMDFADSEGVSLDQEEDLGGLEAPLEEGLQAHGEAAEDTLDDSKEDAAGNEEDAFEIDLPKTTSGNDRSYNGEENLNEDCDDDVEEGGGDGGLVEEEDCINDDHMQPMDNADVLSEDLTSDHVDVGEGDEEQGEEDEGDGYHHHHQEGEENIPGTSCDNSA